MNGPSRTALGVALHRAAHQTLDGGRIFKDPFARAILGPDADAAIAARVTPRSRHFRQFLAVRARFAEDALARAVADGCEQLVVLGAGLDTFALRNPFARLRVFEVDHPDTQDWKRRQLGLAGLDLPPCLRFVPADFEHKTFGAALDESGFDPLQPAFFIWLGVVPYLSADAIGATLDFVTAIPRAQIVFDYPEPLENYDPRTRVQVEALRQRAAGMGEPWLSYFDPPQMAALLRRHGFDNVEDLGPVEIGMRYLNRPDKTPRAGAHVVRAWRKT